MDVSRLDKEELAAMAADPNIQREIALINAEFAVTDADGLEPDSRDNSTLKGDFSMSSEIKPRPIPIDYLNGRPVYRLEDAQFLIEDCPWLLD